MDEKGSEPEPDPHQYLNGRDDANRSGPELVQSSDGTLKEVEQTDDHERDRESKRDPLPKVVEVGKRASSCAAYCGGWRGLWVGASNNV
jgi:hypothetical protein